MLVWSQEKGAERQGGILLSLPFIKEDLEGFLVI